MSQQSDQQQQIDSLSETMGAVVIANAAEGAVGHDADDEVGQDMVCAKGPKRSDTSSKASDRLRQTTSVTTASGPQISTSVSVSYLSQIQHQQQQQQQPGCIVSPVTPPTTGFGQVWGSPMPQQQPGASSNLENDENFDILNGLFDLGSDVPVSDGSFAVPVPGVPSGTAQVMIVPPQPPPPSQQPQPQASLVTTSVPKQTGPPVSDSTRRALIRKLNPHGPQSPLVDENFNTPLHSAVMQNQPMETVDFLLSDLKKQKKLLPVINLVNNCGHTPLSLCLKMRRSELIPLMLDFDAAPTQLCGSPTERTNHFHYAMYKCLANANSMQLIITFLTAAFQRCRMDMIGMLAKDRHGKTAMDFLAHRITQVSSQQDAANASFVQRLQSLYEWANKLIAESK